MYHRHSVRCVEKNNSHILMMMSPGITLSSSSVGVITRANIQELRIIGRVSISQSSSIWPDHSGSLEYSTLFISKRSEVVKSEHSIGDDARLQIYSKLEKRQHIYTIHRHRWAHIQGRSLNSPSNSNLNSYRIWITIWFYLYEEEGWGFLLNM